MRYVAISLLALAIDTALLLYLARVVHWDYMVAATIGFLVGSVVHYLLAVRLVFIHRRLAHHVPVESVLYIAIGSFVVGYGERKIFLFGAAACKRVE